MNRLVVALCVLAAVVAVTLGDDKYTDRYDSINLDEVLGNERLLNKYVECLTASDESKCTEDGKALKKVLTEALQTDCSKCTDKQRSGSKKVISYLVDKKPDTWQEILNKYDSSGKFLKDHPEYDPKTKA